MTHLPAARVEKKEATIPAGTAEATPQLFDWSFAPGEVTEVVVTMADGAAGLVGWQLAIAGQNIIPVTRDAFMIGNDRVWELAIEGYPNSGAWQLRAYNADTFDHTLYGEFYIGVIRPPIEVSPAPIPAEELVLPPEEQPTEEEFAGALEEG